MIDWTRVADLHDEIGEAGFNEVVEVFVQEMDSIVAQLRDAPEPHQLEMTLHALRGGLLNLGFTHVSALCQQGEALAAKGHPDQVDTRSIVQGYDSACQIFLSEVAQRLGHKASAG